MHFLMQKNFGFFWNLQCVRTDKGRGAIFCGHLYGPPLIKNALTGKFGERCAVFFLISADFSIQIRMASTGCYSVNEMGGKNPPILVVSGSPFPPICIKPPNIGGISTKMSKFYRFMVMGITFRGCLCKKEYFHRCWWEYVNSTECGGRNST